MPRAARHAVRRGAAMSARGFRSVLVANRGEIAVRLLRTVQAEGLRGIAVFTDADRDAPHVALADRAVRIGEGPAADSYLSIPRLIVRPHAIRRYRCVARSCWHPLQSQIPQRSGPLSTGPANRHRRHGSPRG